MSRIGKKPIELPAKVTAKIATSGDVKVEGPKGSLTWSIPQGVSASVDGNFINVVCNDKSANALFGLSRALINNMVIGVYQGYVKDLEIQGVGFKAAVKGKILQLNLGYSHEINHPIPDGLKVTVAENTKIKVEGIEKQLVGQFAAEVRNFYPPEPYKGKGVRYAGEKIIRKEGKTVQ
jgi:large subunit ribosomal protein L6